MLDLELEAMGGPGSIPAGGWHFFSGFCNPDLHNIARNDSLGFKTKYPTDLKHSQMKFLIKKLMSQHNFNQPNNI